MWKTVSRIQSKSLILTHLHESTISYRVSFVQRKQTSVLPDRTGGYIYWLMENSFPPWIVGSHQRWTYNSNRTINWITHSHDYIYPTASQKPWFIDTQIYRKPYFCNTKKTPKDIPLKRIRTCYCCCSSNDTHANIWRPHPILCGNAKQPWAPKSACITRVVQILCPIPKWIPSENRFNARRILAFRLNATYWLGESRGTHTQRCPIVCESFGCISKIE